MVEHPRSSADNASSNLDTCTPAPFIKTPPDIHESEVQTAYLAHSGQSG
jgi:hypothetical protein